MYSFSDKLKELRLRNNVSQKQIADGTGVAESQYQKYEYGKTKPNFEYIIKLCQFFNVSADYLLCLDPHEPAQPPADFAADELLKEFHKLDDGYKRFALEQVRQIYILQEKQKAEGVVYR